MFHGVGTLELWAISFWYSTNTCRWPSFLAILSAMLSVCCISSKMSYSCTVAVQGQGIPLRGLRIVSRQFILSHVVNFWPKYWFITWVNPSCEYSLLGSDSLFGSEQEHKTKSRRWKWDQKMKTRSKYKKRGKRESETEEWCQFQ